MLGFSPKDMGIDLGTANTLIYVRGQGVVLNEPTCIAYDKRNSKIIATGARAKAMYGKAPKDITVVKPIQNGVICNFDMAVEMLQRLIRRALGGKKPSGATVVVGVPSGVTSVEKNAVKEAITLMGAKEVFVLDEPIAASIGVGLNIDCTNGTMIVDIGGGTTDVAILSLGGIVSSTSLRYAGDKFDEAIINYVKRKKGVLIGDRTAEAIKISTGSAMLEITRDGREVLRYVQASGRDIISGLPKSFKVSNKDMVIALNESMEMIVETIKSTIEKAPPEIASDIAVSGIVLTGGGAMIENLDRLIMARTGIKVLIPSNPYETVVSGAGKCLNRIDKLRVYAAPNSKDR